MKPRYPSVSLSPVSRDLVQVQVRVTLTVAVDYLNLCMAVNCVSLLAQVGVLF